MRGQGRYAMAFYILSDSRSDVRKRMTGLQIDDGRVSSRYELSW